LCCRERPHFTGANEQDKFVLVSDENVQAASEVPRAGKRMRERTQSE
jgi:hypothetical protein